MTCLYVDDPQHEEICYICAPRWVLVKWELAYRWDRLLRWLVKRRTVTRRYNPHGPGEVVTRDTPEYREQTWTT